MAAINVKSEIKPLKKVLLHRPGRELLNLTPDTLERLLFDDIPFLEVAQQEHDAFAQVLRDNGVEVVYLEQLTAEALDTSDEIRDKFIYQWITEAGITTEKWQKKVYEFMIENYGNDNKALVDRTFEGIVLNEIKADNDESLVDLMSDSSRLLIDPMPNAYFTRDPFASVGNGVTLHKMYSVTRCRETIYGEYIFNYHPEYKGQVPFYYDRYKTFHIEGGDVLNLNDTTLAIGISQRTEADAIESLARHIFNDNTASIRKILAFDIPESRAFMHLDTVFTQIDVDKFTIHPGILGPLTVYELTPGNGDDINVKKIESDLESILADALGVPHVELIKCGGEDRIAAEREQWNDGSNTLCIAPGTVVVYQRNTVTNELLRQKGIKVLEIPSAELSRGRGGPRCMSMPLVRED